MLVPQNPRRDLTCSEHSCRYNRLNVRLHCTCSLVGTNFRQGFSRNSLVRESATWRRSTKGSNLRQWKYYVLCVWVLLYIGMISNMYVSRIRKVYRMWSHDFANWQCHSNGMKTFRIWKNLQSDSYIVCVSFEKYHLMFLLNNILFGTI